LERINREERKMKQKKIMLLALIGLMPFLLAFRFGAEMRYGDPIKFQVNSDGYAMIRDIAVGDVDGDGDQDIIVIYNLSTSAYKRNEVRIYLNQNAELGGTGPTALGGTPSGTVKDISTLFSNSDENGTGNMYKIYQDGWRGVQGNTTAGYGPYFGRTSADMPISGIPSGVGDSTNDYRSYFSRLAVAYKTVSGKRVVDYILVARSYGPNGATWYPSFAWPQRRYAGRIIQLKNPYVLTANANDVKGAWLKKDAILLTQTHPGNLNHFDPGYPTSLPSTLDADFYKDDYTWKVPVGDDAAKASLSAIELADLNGDGHYDLYAAPRQYHNADQSGDNVQYAGASIYRYDNTGTDDFGLDYNDGSPAGNFIWSDGSTGGTYNQFSDFHLVDINKDGIPDLLGLQGGGSSAPLSWIQGRNTAGFFNTNCKNAQLNTGGTMADIWAGNLRAPTSGTEGDNNNGYPDLLCTRAAEPKIEVSMYSNKNEATPSTATYSEWQAIYSAPSEEVTDVGNVWMWNIKFGHVMTADVDNCGQNEIIVTISGRTAQYWIFKKQTTRYLTMMNLDELR
jgi:hypothetical protein